MTQSITFYTLCLAEGMSAWKAILLSVVGVVLIVAVLALLMFAIKLMSRLMGHKSTAAKEQSDQTMAQVAETVESKDEPEIPLNVKLQGVEEKEAAMIMAIVADSTDIPLEKLRFIRITRLEEEEGK